MGVTLGAVVQAERVETYRSAQQHFQNSLGGFRDVVNRFQFKKGVEEIQTLLPDHPITARLVETGNRLVPPKPAHGDYIIGGFSFVESPSAAADAKMAQAWLREAATQKLATGTKLGGHGMLLTGLVIGGAVAVIGGAALLLANRSNN